LDKLGGFYADTGEYVPPEECDWGNQEQEYYDELYGDESDNEDEDSDADKANDD